MASASYERRNARARALGYASYYDYRVHNHGRIAPSEPAPTGEARSRLRGHRGAADFERALSADVVVVPIDSRRDPDTGRFLWVDVDVDDGRTSRRFRLRPKDMTADELDSLWLSIQDAGASWAHNPSINLFAAALELAA